MAFWRVVPHISMEACRLAQTLGLSGERKILQRISAPKLNTWSISPVVYFDSITNMLRWDRYWRYLP